MKRVRRQIRTRLLALVIPAHNEQQVIHATIGSAIKAGQNPRDIFVVDDGSSDATAALAVAILGADNVLSVPKGGKAMAVKRGVQRFALDRRYTWIHIADADGVFAPDYFQIFKRSLRRPGYVAATGYVESLKGDWISRYRSFEYTWGQETSRRIQSWLGVITVIPGPTSCFKSSIFDELDFEVGSLTEDFDITLQIYRKKLGRIQFVPAARASTQDPRYFRDYVSQITRWYRGTFQGIKRHKVGLRMQKIDAYMMYTLLQTFIYYYLLLIFFPVMAITSGDPSWIASFFLADLALFFGISAISAAVSRRWDILAAFPFFYILRHTNMFIFCKAFFEVVVLNRFRNDVPGWSTDGRRYQIVAR